MNRTLKLNIAHLLWFTFFACLSFVVFVVEIRVGHTLIALWYLTLSGVLAFLGVSPWLHRAGKECAEK
jgi:uncharacterized membrane protein